MIASGTTFFTSGDRRPAATFFVRGKCFPNQPTSPPYPAVPGSRATFKLTSFRAARGVNGNCAPTPRATPFSPDRAGVTKDVDDAARRTSDARTRIVPSVREGEEDGLAGCA